MHTNVERTVVLLIKEGALSGPEGPDFFFSFFQHGDPFIFEFFRSLNMETPLFLNFSVF